MLWHDPDRVSFPRQSWGGYCWSAARLIRSTTLEDNCPNTIVLFLKHTFSPVQIKKARIWDGAVWKKRSPDETLPTRFFLTEGSEQGGEL
jgi:hypothetical protein